MIGEFLQKWGTGGIRHNLRASSFTQDLSIDTNFQPCRSIPMDSTFTKAIFPKHFKYKYREVSQFFDLCSKCLHAHWIVLYKLNNLCQRLHTNFIYSSTNASENQIPSHITSLPANLFHTWFSEIVCYADFLTIKLLSRMKRLPNFVVQYKENDKEQQITLGSWVHLHNKLDNITAVQRSHLALLMI